MQIRGPCTGITGFPGDFKGSFSQDHIIWTAIFWWELSYREIVNWVCRFSRWRPLSCNSFHLVCHLILRGWGNIPKLQILRPLQGTRFTSGISSESRRVWG